MGKSSYSSRVMEPAPPSGSLPASTLRRRRAPNATEQARREEWGKKWSEVGRQHAIEKGWRAKT